MESRIETGIHLTQRSPFGIKKLGDVKSGTWPRKTCRQCSRIAMIKRLSPISPATRSKPDSKKSQKNKTTTQAHAISGKNDSQIESLSGVGCLQAVSMFWLVIARGVCILFPPGCGTRHEMKLNAILYPNGDYGSRWPGQPTVDSAPQPDETIKNTQLQVTDLCSF